MSVVASTPIDLSWVGGSYEAIEAVLLITPAGTQLGAWTRNPVSVDVLRVMSATLVGSIESLMNVLGSPSPHEVSLLIDARRVLVSRIGPQTLVIIVGTKGTTEMTLRTAVRKIVRSLPPRAIDDARSRGRRAE